MPSASSKSEKSASAEVADPFSRAIIVVEHKIRNLEKRKGKLETYKESTKALTKEQVEALSKHRDILTQLELSREYLKNFNQISIEHEKLKKKLARKELQERFHAEVGKVKLVLQMQDVLASMGAEAVREDFLAGKNGATKLTEQDLKALDDLYVEVSPKRLSDDGKPFPNDQFKKAAEYFMAIIEAKNKDLVGVPCSRLKELIFSIFSCGYFEKTSGEEPVPEQTPAPEQATTETPEEEEEFHETQEILTNVIVPSQNPPEDPLPPAPVPTSDPVPAPTPIQPIIPGAPIIPAAQPPIIAPNQPQILDPSVSNIVPTPVSQVESSFFNAQGFKPPAPQSAVPPPAQNTRQINDVIQSVTGKFNFLQESELEISEMNTGGVSSNPPAPAPQVPNAPTSGIQSRTKLSSTLGFAAGQTFNGKPVLPFPIDPEYFKNFDPGFAYVPIPNFPTPANNNNTSTNNGNNNINSNPSPIPIPIPASENPNVSFNQNQQQIPSSTFTPQTNTQPGSQPASQPSAFHQNNVNVAPVDNKLDDTVRPESERKEKPQDTDFKEWNQRQTGNWADDVADSNEWNQPNAQGDGTSNSNKYSGRNHRNDRNGGGGGSGRNTNGYQGNRNRERDRDRDNRQRGFRDSQNNQGGNNFYQNQNGYQSRNERNNEYPGKGNTDFSRDNNFKERGDYSNRDNRDGYGGSGRFKGGNGNRDNRDNRDRDNRGSNMKGSLDRSDRQGQARRNNNGGGPRRDGPPRNMNRQPGGGNGPSFQKQPNQPGQPSK